MKYFFIGLLFLGHLVYGQDARFEYGLSQQQARSYPLELCVGNHAVSMPFRKMLRLPFHPAVTVGTEWAWREKNEHKFFSPLKLGFFYNTYNSIGLFLGTGAAYRYTHSIGIFADAGAEIAYLHHFRPFAKLVFKDGFYESEYDFGKPSLMLGGFMSVGYDFYQNSELPLSIFLRYMFFGQTPYNDTLSDVLPQTILMLGVRWTFGEAVRCPKF